MFDIASSKQGLAQSIMQSADGRVKMGAVTDEEVAALLRAGYVEDTGHDDEFSSMDIADILKQSRVMPPQSAVPGQLSMSRLVFASAQDEVADEAAAAVDQEEAGEEEEEEEEEEEGVADMQIVVGAGGDSAAAAAAAAEARPQESYWCCLRPAAVMADDG